MRPEIGADRRRLVDVDSAQALRSLESLTTTAAATVLTGHGDPWTDGVTSAVDRALAAGPF